MKYKGTFASDLSGKLGGIVASHNKAGGYFRAFTTPTQPNTVIQSWARARFASASSAWHGLTDPQKNIWNLFAVTDFKAQRGNIPGVTYTGAQAFTSLRTTAIGQEDYKNGTISTPAVTATYGTFTAPTTAPANNFGGIPTIAGVPYPLILKSATFQASTATLTATFEGGGGLTLPTAPDFVDFTSGLGFGFGFYLSMPGVQANTYKPNAGFTLLASCGQPTITLGWISGTSFTVTAIGPANIATRHKLWYGVLDFVKVTAFAVSSTTGQSAPLGNYDVAVL